jgi:uncharacterized membrane protein
VKFLVAIFLLISVFSFIPVSMASSVPEPSINYNPIPAPSMPSWPSITITIPLINFKITIPDPTKIPQFLTDFVSYIFLWIAVQIFNFLLMLIQIFYLFFAWIEYYLLQAILNITSGAGIFALPLMVFLVIVIGLVIYLLIYFAKDITIVGAV